MRTTILGAGISALSVSFHIGHNQCVIFEKEPVHGGHAGSEKKFGFTMDRGPHVSFTRDPYVKQLFADNVNGKFHEVEVVIKNYYIDRWIDHPAQFHLWQIGEPLNEICAIEMLNVADSPTVATNYQEWLRGSFGTTFAGIFSEAYTRKYWTVEASELSIDWLGPRIAKPTPDEIRSGMLSGTRQSSHYITKIRYPSEGGYQSFFEPLATGADIRYNKTLSAIDLKSKTMWFSDGSSHFYERLVSTIPLPEFVTIAIQATPEVKAAAALLACSQLLLVDVLVPEPAMVDGHWFYVYDPDKWSTRIHCIERLSENNTPENWSCIQVEVYFSKFKPFPGNPSAIADEVVEELIAMGFIKPLTKEESRCRVQWRWCSYANVIFTHQRREALEKIWSWLEPYGLTRRSSDTDSMSDWTFPPEPEGHLIMAGRFAEWKYHWTDDCILRGRQIAQSLLEHK